VLQIEGLLSMDLVFLTHSQSLKQKGFAAAGFFFYTERLQFLSGSAGDDEGGLILL
jgi:hypothetical protein